MGPKKIVVISSAPMICYPDCYGIDMAKLGDFVAFRAAIALTKKSGREDLLKSLYEEAKEMVQKPKEENINVVKKLFEPLTQKELELEIADQLRPVDFKPELEIIYQSIEDTKKAIPNHQGLWYFDGNYPTPGGNKVVN